MKILTVATESEGYFGLLKETAEKWGYDLNVLGWHQKWKGFAWKIELYLEALSKLPNNDIVICVDGYDVVVLAPADEMLAKFKTLQQGIVFSGQRYFPNQKGVQKLADQVMSNDFKKVISGSKGNKRDYSRPCMGLLIGYASELNAFFNELIKIEKEISINDDQTLVNIYYVENPIQFIWIMNVEYFKIYGELPASCMVKSLRFHKSSDVEVYFDKEIEAMRIRNKKFGTLPCLLHAPFNLDIGMLLKEMNLEAPPLSFKKDWHYFKYSIAHHIRRAVKLIFHLN